MLNNIPDLSAKEARIFLIETALILGLTLLQLAGSYDSNIGILFGCVKEILMQDFEHVKILEIVTQGYILHHLSNLQQILIPIVGNVHSRGVAYVNLIFECLLGTFPLHRVPLLINGEIVNTIANLIE